MRFFSVRSTAVNSLNEPSELPILDPEKDVVGDRVPSRLSIGSVMENVHECSYLEDRTANLPLNLPAKLLDMQEVDAALEVGMRRAGVFLYYTACAGCQACEPTRVDVSAFRWTDSWRRILNRGDRLLSLSIAPASISEEKLALFNRHRTERRLSDDGTLYQFGDYESFLVDSCCQHTIEFQFRLEERLIAVSVIDCGANSVSAVYTFFNPDYSKLSLGTYSILKQIEFCSRTDRQYMYLGMYVARNTHLNYKARFQPQQRWINCRWVDIDSRA